MASFEEVATAKHASFMDALNTRALEVARLHVKYATIAAFEQVAKSLDEQGFNHPSPLDLSSPTTVFNHELAQARSDLYRWEGTTGVAIETAERLRAEDIKHFEEHTEEYYEWALELARAAGKEIQLGERADALLQSA